MSMTKRDFVALADALRPYYETAESAVSARWLAENMVRVVGDVCAASNPNFNLALWTAYLRGECGPNGGKR